MKILLDTHIFLWFITNNRRLDERFRIGALRRSSN
ncbi:type II toxin-antitoxin system VapC family toxin [Spirulina subsalsa]|nr:type II toxin-antitoxin system VapC family toxin [Spirulina subsalsa]